MRFSRLFSLTFVIIGLSLWTLAPYGGCSCNNTLGPSNIGPNSGPTATQTPDHGPLVDDFEKTGTLATNFGGAINTAADGSTTSMVPPDPYAPPNPLSQNSTINAPNTVVVAGGSTLPGGTPAYAAHVTGYIGHDGAAAPYPFAQLILGLGSSANVPFYAPNKRLKFSFKAVGASVGKPMFVNFTDSVITDYSWYRYTFTPATSAWTSYTVYFPDGVGPAKFFQACWGSCKKWNASTTCNGLAGCPIGGAPPANYVVNNINAVVFQPVPLTAAPPAGARYVYDYYVDDVTFE